MFGVKLPTISVLDRERVHTLIQIYREKLHSAYLQNEIPKLPDEIKEVKYTLRGLTAGRAYYYSGLINLNPFFLIDEKTKEDMFEETLPHEAAHIFSFQIYGRDGIGHNENWRKVFKTIAPAATTMRCHNYDSRIARPRLEFTCPCGRKFELKFKQQNLALKGKLHCRNCGETLVIPL